MQQIDAAHTRQLHINKEQIRHEMTETLERLLGACDRGNLEAGSFRQEHYKLQVDGIVINDESARGRHSVILQGDWSPQGTPLRSNCQLLVHSSRRLCRHAAQRAF